MHRSVELDGCILHVSASGTVVLDHAGVSSNHHLALIVEARCIADSGGYAPLRLVERRLCGLLQFAPPYRAVVMLHRDGLLGAVCRLLGAPKVNHAPLPTAQAARRKDLRDQESAAWLHLSAVLPPLRDVARRVTSSPRAEGVGLPHLYILLLRDGKLVGNLSIAVLRFHIFHFLHFYL